MRDGGFDRTGWETGRSVAGTRRARRRGRLARASRAFVRCCREDDRPLTGRTESYSKQRGVGLRHVNASDVVAANSARQRFMSVEPLLGDAACALQDALRGAQRACTLVVQLLELRQPGRRVHAPPGEQFVERGVLRAPIPRFP